MERTLGIRFEIEFIGLSPFKMLWRTSEIIVVLIKNFNTIFHFHAGQVDFSILHRLLYLWIELVNIEWRNHLVEKFILVWLLKENQLLSFRNLFWIDQRLLREYLYFLRAMRYPTDHPLRAHVPFDSLNFIVFWIRIIWIIWWIVIIVFEPI